MRPRPRAAAAILTLAVWACVDGTGPHAPAAVPVSLSLHVPAGVSAEETQALQAAFDRVDTYDVLVREASTAEVIHTETFPVPSGLDAHLLTVDLAESTLGLAVEVSVVGLASGTELYRTSYETIVTEAGTSGPVVLSVRYTGPGIRGIVTDPSGAGLDGVGVGLYQDQALIASATTEPDGTYLFLDVAEGGYAVRPTPPPSLFVCPAGRDLTYQTDAALVVDFTATPEPCQIDLLVLAGGDFDDTQTVADLFLDTPGVKAQRFFYLNRTPGLSTLRQFDVVLLFTNGIFDETVRLGDELAQYVDAGGNLVIGTFYWQARSDSELPTPGWGALEAIDPFRADTEGLKEGGATYELNVLGPVLLPNHPTIVGVSQMVSIAGFSAGVLPKQETTVVAEWEDGAPLVGYRVLPIGQRIVGVSLFPAASSPDQVEGDVQVLWENAVTWAGMAGGPAP